MKDQPLYTPYKSIGLVTDGTPFVVSDLGGETFLTVSVGDAFQIYRAGKLTLCLVSRKVPCGRQISTFQASGHDTFVAVDRLIYVYNRVEIVRTYDEHLSPITGMILVGALLLSYDSTGRVSLINVKDRTLEGIMDVAESSSSSSPSSVAEKGEITACCHPLTYVNKFVFAFANGAMELWNIRKKKKIYSFQSHLPFVAEGHTICNMGASPAVDVIALGFSSGAVVGINLRLDKVIFAFQQESGLVTSLSFRTDVGNNRNPHLATGDSEGRLHIWKLGGSRPQDDDGAASAQSDSHARGLHTIIDAHTHRIGEVHYLYGEPILVTASADNSLKMWIFDAADGSARLLKSREGHCGYATSLRYYGGLINTSMRDGIEASSCEILSSGTDGTLRIFNTAVESQNRELSQRPILAKLGMRARGEKLSVVTQFDCSEAREADWANVVTCHLNSANVHLWRYKKNTITETILRPKECTCSGMLEKVSSAAFHATTVAMSACGNFCIVGTKTGKVYVYNAQSGAARGTFPATTASLSSKGQIAKLTKTPGHVLHEHKAFIWSDKKKKKNNSDGDDTASSSSVAHGDAVTGLFIDLANTTLVTAGMDGMLSFWDFSTRELLERIDVGAPIHLMTGFRDADYFAVATMDRSIMLFDMATRKSVRNFKGHSREVTAMAFTPDGHRFVSSSMDSTLRVWDIVTARCLNWLSFPTPISSMSFSLSGDFLVVSMMNKAGLFLYADRSMYETFMYDKEPAEPTPVSDCNPLVEDSLGENVEYDHEGDTIKENQEGGVGDEALSGSQPFTNVGGRRHTDNGDNKEDYSDLTFALTPRAYWTGLFNLEEIKSRNKPVEATKDRVAAPFFLPSLQNSAVVSGSAPALPSAWGDADDDGTGTTDAGVTVSAPPTSSRIMRGFNSMPRCRLAKYLVGDLDAVDGGRALIGFLKTLLPSAVDIEFRSLCLSPTDIEGCDLVRRLLKHLASGLKRKEDFEVTQAYLSRALSVFGTILLDASFLKPTLEELQIAQHEASSQFRTGVGSTLAVLQHLQNLPL